MTPYTPRITDLPTAALHYFERHRASSLARLAAVTRQWREEMDSRVAAARATMAEAAWAEAGWAEGYRGEAARPDANRAEAA